MTTASKEREFRYICQWFSEFSELQREDFVPVLVEYLTKEEIYMNGVVNSLSVAGCDDKPMSLYQCRIKLFKEWSPKWPDDMKMKLKEKITELDSKIGEKLEQELSTVTKGNGHIPNGKMNGHLEVDPKDEIEIIDKIPEQPAIAYQEPLPELEQIDENQAVEQNIEVKEDEVKENNIE